MCRSPFDDLKGAALDAGMRGWPWWVVWSVIGCCTGVSSAWTGVPDLDWVVEGDGSLGLCVADPLWYAAGLFSGAWGFRHGGVQLDGIPLDLAQRAEHYPALQRIPWCGAPFRLTLRAGTSRLMPWPRSGGQWLIDLHHGQEDLASGRLRFYVGVFRTTHPGDSSCRYAARLVSLAEEVVSRSAAPLLRRPWAWSRGDAAFLHRRPRTRLRMELERCWSGTLAAALDLLEQWQALPLLDSHLQNDPWRTRLHWARRWSSLDACSFVESRSPVAVAQRLQIPGKQQQWLRSAGLRDWLVDTPTRPPRRSGQRLSNNKVGLRKCWQ